MTNMITHGQLRSLRTALKAVTDDTDGWVYIVGRLIGREISRLGALTRQEWSTLRNRMYPHWTEDDWTLDAAFRTEIATLWNQYRETVLGQRRLF